MHTMMTGALTLVVLAMAGVAGPAAADASRGRLLYETHCIACHSKQLHWRENRRVTDHASLLAQVGQWQAREGLGWAPADIQAVATYLDRIIYRLPDAPVRGE